MYITFFFLVGATAFVYLVENKPVVIRCPRAILSTL